LSCHFEGTQYPRNLSRCGPYRFVSQIALTRDENLRAIRRTGRAAWKRAFGYHVRSLYETAMFRLKTILGDRLPTCSLETQRAQAMVRCAALNTMTYSGMPHSYKVD